MIPGDLISAFPHRQFHTLPGLLDSWAALPNSYPNACMHMLGSSLYHFYDGLWYDPAGKRTHDLPCERRTRYRLSQPDTVYCRGMHDFILATTSHIWMIIGNIAKTGQIEPNLEYFLKVYSSKKILRFLVRTYITHNFHNREVTPILLGRSNILHLKGIIVNVNTFQDEL